MIQNINKYSIFKKRLYYTRKYWRLIIHLVFKTKYFGVNNLWWVSQPSSIGHNTIIIFCNVIMVMPIIRNYQSLKVRSKLGWIPLLESKSLGF